MEKSSEEEELVATGSRVHAFASAGQWVEEIHSPRNSFGENIMQDAFEELFLALVAIVAFALVMGCILPPPGKSSGNGSGGYYVVGSSQQ